MNKGMKDYETISQKGFECSTHSYPRENEIHCKIILQTTEQVKMIKTWVRKNLPKFVYAGAKQVGMLPNGELQKASDLDELTPDLPTTITQKTDDALHKETIQKTRRMWDYDPDRGFYFFDEPVEEDEKEECKKKRK